jgi:diguanylate cyclase (GGDEF)-like protein
MRTLAQGAPILSYSADGGAAVNKRSRALGFARHLAAPLSPLEIEHQAAIGAPVDLATRWRRAETTLVRYLGRIDPLLEVTRHVAAALEPVPVADALVARAAAWLPGQSWAVVGPDAGGTPIVMAAIDAPPAAETAIAAVGARVMRSGRLVASANLGADRRGTCGLTGAAVVFPLRSRGRTVGALVGFDASPSRETPEVSSRLATILGHVLEAAAIALDNALRMRRAQALTVTDDLTQLFNSRYLSEVLRREGKRAVRTRQPLSLLFIDLDGFKEINDTHGHLYGSRALVEAGNVIRECARETDVVARFGGDEFAVVLPDTPSDGALVVADRIRERIATYLFLGTEGYNFRLTVSAGVATLPDCVPTVDGLLQAADDAMYWVKAHGKDGTQVAGAVA